ncbi:MAG: aminoacyl-histidine dipeptidase [Hyphomicrobiales bacterium]
MSDQIKNLEPKALWTNFYKLTQIPRPSKSEVEIQKALVQFGEELGLETIKDEVGNIIIRKPATEGMEDRMGVILQAHLDMVPQKNADTAHDFEKDPIQTYIDEEWVKAKGTTLGADNGIGAAAAMAILQSKDIAHGLVEVLLTSDEETGMTGANGLQPNVLKGDILMNLDSEDEGELYVGCAGGVDTNVEYCYSEVEVPANVTPFEIIVKGLRGGHSGMDINQGRGNANKIMNALLITAEEKFGIRLAIINGGSLRNAIPRESFATIVVPNENLEGFKTLVKEFEVIVKDEFKKADPNVVIEIVDAEMPKTIINNETAVALYKGIAECPNGVMAMSKDFEGVVEVSSNLAVVKSENGIIELGSLQRGSDDQGKDDLATKIAKAFTDQGAKAVHEGAYPGWKPNPESKALALLKSVYNQKFGKEPLVKVIHAGLECGILGAAYPNWDMISFGPTIRNPHSPDEKVNVKTVGMFYEFLQEALKNVPKK